MAGLKTGGGAIADDAPMLEQEETVSDLQFNPFQGQFRFVSFFFFLLFDLAFVVISDFLSCSRQRDCHLWRAGCDFVEVP